MTAESVTPSARIAASYKKLAASAQALNSKSDELTKLVGVLDAALKRLNLGITAWERIRGSDGDEYDNYWSQDVGYAKIDGKWGISIRERSGNHNSPDNVEVSEWLFSDAPRPMRIDAIDVLPALVEKLIANADKTTRKIDEKLPEVGALADALTDAAVEVEQQRKGRRS